MKLAFKKWVENIQTAAYNGTHMVTVSIFLGLASTPLGAGLVCNIFSTWYKIGLLKRK